MPANQELLFRRVTFLRPMGVWVEGIKGACSSGQMRLLWYFSPAPGVCVVDSAPTHPQPPRDGRRAVQGTDNTGQFGTHHLTIGPTTPVACSFQEWVNHPPIVSGCKTLQKSTWKVHWVSVDRLGMSFPVIAFLNSYTKILAYEGVWSLFLWNDKKAQPELYILFQPYNQGVGGYSDNPLVIMFCAFSSWMWWVHVVNGYLHCYRGGEYCRLWDFL